MVSNTIQCLKVKLKPGSVHKIKAWVSGLYKNRQAVDGLMQSQSIIFENMFLEYEDGEHYLLFITKAKNIEKANQAFQASNHPIDLQAKAIMGETWDLNNIKQLECLLDLQPE